VLSLVDNPQASITYKPLPVDDPKVRKPDISLARKVLGWEPQVNRTDGMARTYEYFKNVVKVSDNSTV